MSRKTIIKIWLLLIGLFIVIMGMAFLLSIILPPLFCTILGIIFGFILYPIVDSIIDNIVFSNKLNKKKGSN